MNQTDATLVYCLEDAEDQEAVPDQSMRDLKPRDKVVKLQIYNKAAEQQTGVRFNNTIFHNNLGADTPILI